MKIGVLTFEKYRGQKNIGSSKIRGHWVIDRWHDAEEFVQGKKYDAVIYQKAYMIDHAKCFDGVKIFDVCDPDFLHWGYQFKEMVDTCDAVTTSTEPLAEAIRKFTDKPVVCIPDRINLDEVKDRKKLHTGDARWVLWYGYSNNFEVLKSVVPALKRLNLNLVVVSDGAFSLGMGYDKDIELINKRFNWEHIYDDIQDADIIVNPQKKTGKWRFKSNNKTLLSWALGMPVANTFEDLERFISAEERNKEQEIRRKELEEKWDVKYSADQYKELIESLKK